MLCSNSIDRRLRKHNHSQSIPSESTPRRLGTHRGFVLRASAAMAAASSSRPGGSEIVVPLVTKPNASLRCELCGYLVLGRANGGIRSAVRLWLDGRQPVTECATVYSCWSVFAAANLTDAILGDSMAGSSGSAARSNVRVSIHPSSTSAVARIVPGESRSDCTYSTHYLKSFVRIQDFLAVEWRFWALERQQS